MPVTSTAPASDASDWPSGGHPAALALVGLLFAGVVWSHRDFVPYWDAKGYFDCIAHATQTAFSLQNYRCFGHTTIAYVLPLAFTQSLAPWNLPLTYAANALLGLGSIAAYHALLRRLFPERSPLEYALVTALYALAPLFVVHAIFFNLDYGMTVFFVPFLYFLLARRVWPASMFAVALVLAKETGAAVFAATIAAYAIAFVIRGNRWREAPLVELRAHAPLLAVPLALVAYIVATRLPQPNPGSWASSYAEVSMLHDPLSALSVNPAGAGMRSLLADLFVLNYQWIYAIVLVAAVCAAIARRAAPGRTPTARVGAVLFLSLLLVELVFVVTRYRDYNNARYVLVALPVLVALFYYSLLSIATHARVRRLVLGVAATLVLLSNFRTIDPVSKAVFGTFAFGSHALLDMPSLLRGPRLDATVYNLESLQFGYLLEVMMQDVRPAPGTVFVMGDASYNFPPRVDARTHALTVDPSRALPLVVLSADGDLGKEALRPRLRGDGGRFFYMAFPNADNHQLRLLMNDYPLVATRRYERHGYAFDLYTFAGN